MFLLFLSLLLAQAQTPAFEFIRGMAIAECAAVKNDSWILYGVSECDEIVPLINEKQNKTEREFYQRWVTFTEQFQKSSSDESSRRDAGIILWYLRRHQRRAEIRESQHIVEFFAPSKEIAKMLNDVAQFISPKKRQALIKKFKLINSSRWIENGWHRYIKQTKQWDNPILPYEREVRDYLENQPGYLAGIESILKVIAEPELNDQWIKMKKNILSYNSYAKDKILPATRKNVAVSSEWYQNYLDKYGIEISPEELISIAEEDYQKTLIEYRRLAAVIAKDQKYPSANPRDVISQFAKQGATKWSEVEQTYRQAERFIKEVIQKSMFMTLPEKPIVMRPATPSEGALFPAPTVIVPPNFSEEPVFVIPVKPDGTFEPSQTHPYAIYSLLAHEGRPGHDQQVRTLLSQKPSVAVLFYAGMADAYAEGWALYSEELIYPFYNDQTKLYALLYRVLRMARAFIDPKLHLGEMKPEQAEKILRDEIGLPEEFITSEMRRYLFLFPGQAASYYAGYLSFKGLRKTFQSEWGKMFRDGCFHDALLRLGGRSFKELEDSLRQQKPCG